MKPHPRIRKATKWTATLASLLLLLAAWVASGWCSVTFAWHYRRALAIQQGCIVHKEGTLGSGPYASCGTFRGFRWWVRSYQYGSGRTVEAVDVPLWIPALPLFSATAAACLLDARATRRALTGHCRARGYDLRTLPPTTPCPECGAGPVAQPRAQ